MTMAEKILSLVPKAKGVKLDSLEDICTAGLMENKADFYKVLEWLVCNGKISIHGQDDMVIKHPDYVYSYLTGEIIKRIILLDGIPFETKEKVLKAIFDIDGNLKNGGAE